MQDEAPVIDDAGVVDDTLIDALLALERQGPRAPSDLGGDQPDAAAQRARLASCLPVSQLCQVWRGGRLVAYGMLTQQTTSTWFVTAFNVHPAHRTPGVLRELLVGMLVLIDQLGIEALWSHVYKTNLAALRLHRALGFEIQRESGEAIEFFLPLAPLQSSRRLARLLHARRA